MLTLGDIAALLAQQAESVCRRLVPRGKKRGGSWTCGDKYGSEGNSLSVTLKGKYAGRWQDFSTDEWGDLLDLWASSQRITLKEARDHALRWLGKGGHL